MRALLALLAALALLGALALPGCGGAAQDEPKGPGPAVGSLASDFALPDVNPASPTVGKSVSPRQSLGVISGWYFGHAT